MAGRYQGQIVYRIPGGAGGAGGAAWSSRRWPVVLRTGGGGPWRCWCSPWRWWRPGPGAGGAGGGGGSAPAPRRCSRWGSGSVRSGGPGGSAAVVEALVQAVATVGPVVLRWWGRGGPVVEALVLISLLSCRVLRALSVVSHLDGAGGGNGGAGGSALVAAVEVLRQRLDGAGGGGSAPAPRRCRRWRSSRGRSPAPLPGSCTALVSSAISPRRWGRWRWYRRWRAGTRGVRTTPAGSD